MPRLSLVLTLLLFLCGCAVPVVYLQPGDDIELADRVKHRLEAKGLDVKPLTSPLPYSIKAAELLIHPLLTGSKVLEQVTDSLQQEGLVDLTVRDFSQSNHFYSPGHLGVYLPSELARLPVVMQTRECGDIRATLERLNDTQVLLEIVADPENIQMPGRYFMRGDTGTVTLAEVSYGFTLTEIEVETFFGLRPADLIRLDSGSQSKQLFDRCEFITVYGG